LGYLSRCGVICVVVDGEAYFKEGSQNSHQIVREWRDLLNSADSNIGYSLVFAFLQQRLINLA
jgi:hypothetical protein